MLKRPFQLSTCLMILALLVAAWPVPAAYAAGIVVTSSGDGAAIVANCPSASSCTLRDAIAVVNGGGGTSISFSLAGPTITLTDGQLSITHDVTITGPGSGLLTLDANHLSRIFAVASGLTVSISGLRLTNGLVNPTTYPTSGGSGGAINNTGFLTLSDVVVTASAANQGGGGIISGGASSSLSMTNSTISYNQVTNPGSLAGGLFVLGGTLALTNVIIDHNQAPGTTAVGGGLYIESGVSPAVLSNVTVTNNSATSDGGMDTASANMTVQNSTFRSNSSGPGGPGAIYNSGTLNVSRTVFDTNHADQGGGAIQNINTLSVDSSTFVSNSAGSGGGAIGQTVGDATITDSTFTQNGAPDGGAIIGNGGTLTIANSTFSGNVAVLHGGGLSNYYSAAVLINNTFSANSAPNAPGGALYQASGTGALSLANNILANSTATDDCVSFLSLSTDSNNLIKNNDPTHPCGSPSVSADPMLAPLANNGGPTQTLALLAGSPALDAGNDTICANAPVSGLDQRGAVRPQGPHCDIGAYEFVDPTVLRVFPPDASQACLTPQIGLSLELTDQVRTGGSFDPAKVSLTLDGSDVTSAARIDQTNTYPASEATILYTPSAGLTAASHTVDFTYPAGTGTQSYRWSFTAASIICTLAAQQAPTLVSPTTAGPVSPQVPTRPDGPANGGGSTANGNSIVP